MHTLIYIFKLSNMLDEDFLTKQFITIKMANSE